MGRFSSSLQILRAIGLGKLVDSYAGSILEVDTDQPVFHITFDDGPDPEVTPRVLDALDEYGARATFFVLVERAARYSSLLREIIDRGHEVGLHGRTHVRLSTAPWPVVHDEVIAAHEELEDLLQRKVSYFRPPFGAPGYRSIYACRKLKLTSVLWSVDTDDWKGLTPDQPLQGTTDRIAPGGISLVHDRPVGESMADEVARGLISKDDLARVLMEEVTRLGLRLVSLRELLEVGAPIKRVTVPGRHRYGMKAQGV
jgi:peptidoglycan/xylan/chitin deacetylase (PgdA/CDA1 family)